MTAQEVGLRREIASEICVYRCQSRPPLKLLSEKGFVHEHGSRMEASPALKGYLRCAIDCGQRRAYDLKKEGLTAFKRLLQCGVVHLRELYSGSFLSDLSMAWSQLEKDGRNLTDTEHLRAEREEWWLPHQRPWNQSTLLWPPSLRSLIQAYLVDPKGGTPTPWVLDYVSGIVSRSGIAKAQDLHSDTVRGRQHLELHIPLTKVETEMGPTRFCPCTHHTHRRGGDAAGLASRVVFRRFGLDQKCEETSETHYDSTTDLTEATLYDASVFHKGLANQAGTHRAVVVVAFAASLWARDERNYTGHLKSRLPEAAEAVAGHRRGQPPGGGARGSRGEL